MVICITVMYITNMNIFYFFPQTKSNIGHTYQMFRNSVDVHTFNRKQELYAVLLAKCFR